ncbi:MAG: YkgJ family cysteine cluster protein [Phycisphaeraceae bacterium]|nr:YkgJ family cysteine cluster protein [Phycisphaeraceae bacterium]
MADSHEHPWYAQGLHFTCTQCGNCCTGPAGYVWFTDAEAHAIAKHLGITLQQFIRRHTRRHGRRQSLTERKTPAGEYDCVFLVTDPDTGRRTCSIYPVRPQQCRTWPFWPENLETEADWLHAAIRCPGMTAGLRGEGQHHTYQQIRIIRDSNTPDE